MIDAVFRHTGSIDGVYHEEIRLGSPFIDVAASFADLAGTVALMSGGELDSARYHILAVRPWLVVKAWANRVNIEADGDPFAFQMDPLDAIQDVIKRYTLSGNDASDPVSAGLFGYLAYDLKDYIEQLPRTTVDDLGLPQICLYAPSAICIHDRHSDRSRLCIPVRSQTGEKGVQEIRQWFFDCLNASGGAGDQAYSGGARGFRSPFSRRTYMAAVEKIRDYIVSGHIYQVNLSQRFETDFQGNPFGMFAELFNSAPASFYAYVNAGDHWIVSTSPERFLMQRGDMVETRPIKGTRPRGKSAEEDKALADELQTSAKDDAELSMIVDLMRNDLGRVCAGGSVKVVAHKRLEAYQNVFHLVSVIQGQLLGGKDAVDLIRAAFPGGSITGCPRIRAMEIIDELEPCRRHIYTGSIGYIGFDDSMDLSIAIRTATISGNRMFFSVGGGVVFDSDPADEYEETLHKGRSVMSVFKGRKSDESKEGRIWLNGTLVPESEARLPITDLGLQYGFGFFETIRVARGRPHLLAAHMSRFNQTWKALFEGPVPDVTWDEIIRQVVCANNLQDGICAVKLMVTRGSIRDAFYRPNLIATAAPYVHRLEQLSKPALDVAIYPHPRQTPLADHKTLNYLYYYRAGQWAKSRGVDEALITNTEGTVSETNTANLLLIQGRKVIRPQSLHVLPGVMETAVIEHLEKDGFKSEIRPVKPQNLSGADMVMLTNSLMGPVAVRSIDGNSLPCDPAWVEKLRLAIFSR